MSEDEYSLRKSAEKVGELYPVLVSKSGDTIDGFHRINAKANWRREVREDIDTPEKVLKARLIANKFRRQVTAEEVRGWINDLAEIALNEYGVQPGEISGWVAEETGYAVNTVNKYLDIKYKDKLQSERGKGNLNPVTPEMTDYVLSAAEPVIREAEPTIDLDTANGLQKAAKALEREAKRKVKAQKTPEQLEAEKEKKALKKREATEKKRIEQTQREKQLKEQARREVTKEVKQELKQELVQDPQFIREVKRTIISPTIPTPREEPKLLRITEKVEAKTLLMAYISQELNQRLEEYYLKTNTMKDEAIEQLLWRALNGN